MKSQGRFLILLLALMTNKPQDFPMTAVHSLALSLSLTRLVGLQKGPTVNNWFSKTCRNGVIKKNTEACKAFFPCRV